MALTMCTITGQMFAPDGVTPMPGKWFFEVVSDVGMVLDHDYEGFRLGVAEFASEPDGSFSFELPATTQVDSEPTEYSYRMWFRSKNGAYQIDKQYIKLTVDSTIDTLLETPVDLPVTPSLVAEAKQYRDEARAAAEGVSLEPIKQMLNGGQPDLSDLDTNAQTDLVSAINEVLSAVGAGGVSFEYLVLTPSAGWSIIVPGALGRRPNVTLYDEDGKQMFADVDATPTSVFVAFPTPTAGSAVLS